MQYLHGQSCSERSLFKSMRQKHVVDHNGLHDALYYHWKFDTEIFALELKQRVLNLESEPQHFDMNFNREENASISCRELFKDVIGCKETIAK